MRGRRELGARLAGNASLSAIGQVVVALLGLVWVPYVTAELGTTRFGVLILLMTYVEAFSLLSIGLNASLIKHLAELCPGHDVEHAREYLWAALTFLMAIGLTVSVLAICAGDAVTGRLVLAEPALQGEVRRALGLATAALVVRLIGQSLAAVPMAAQRLGWVTAVAVLCELGRVVGSMLAVRAGARLPGVLAVTVVMAIVALVANAIVAHAVAPGIIARPNFSPARLLRLWRMSILVGIGNLSGRLVQVADLTIIGLVGTPASVAFYAVPYAIGQRVWTMLCGLAAVVLPAGSALNAEGERRQLAELYIRGSKLVSAVACLPTVSLLVFGPSLLRYWLGEEWAREGGVVLRLLVLGFVVNSFGHVPYQLLQAVGQVAVTARVSIIYSLCNVICFLTLIPPFGIVGAGAAFLLSQLVIVPWFIRLSNDALGADAHRLAAAYGRVGRTAVVALAVTMSLGLVANSFPATVAAAGAGLAVHAALTIHLVLDTEERTICALLLRSVWRFTAGVARLRDQGVGA